MYGIFDGAQDSFFGTSLHRYKQFHKFEETVPNHKDWRRCKSELKFANLHDKIGTFVNLEIPN